VCNPWKLWWEAHTNIWKQPYRSTELFQPIATKEHNTRKWSFELKERHFILLKQTKMTIALSIHRYGSITLQTTLYLQALLSLNYTWYSSYVMLKNLWRTCMGTVIESLEECPQACAAFLAWSSWPITIFIA
jgi:hypothetical protein